MVTGIVVENEQIGPTRYIAKLGVLFDRAAGAILGVSVQVLRSPPMLLVPVEWSGGTAIPRARHALARLGAIPQRCGTIDYVKPRHWARRAAAQRRADRAAGAGVVARKSIAARETF